MLHNRYFVGVVLAWMMGSKDTKFEVEESNTRV